MTSWCSLAMRWLVRVVLLLVVFAATVARAAEPEMHKRLQPLQPWIDLVDDPAHADSAWAGIGELLPTLPDSAQRGFGWYLMFSAAAALGHVDSMRVAAESSFVYSPNDPSGFRDLAHRLARERHHLELALASAQRVVDVPNQPIGPGVRLEDLRWLGHCQLLLEQDAPASATFERYVREAPTADAWVHYRLAEIRRREGRAAERANELQRGVVAYPQDSTARALALRMLDTLRAAREVGGVRSAAELERAFGNARRVHWLDGHRDGHTVPAGAFASLEGPAETLRDAKGLTVVYAWTTWCGPCRQSLPVLAEWAHQPRTKPVRVVSINADGAPFDETGKRVAAFMNERKLALPVLLADSAAAVRWGMRSFPTTFVLRDGHIVFRNHAGGLVEGLEAQLASLGSTPARPR